MLQNHGLLVVNFRIGCADCDSTLKRASGRQHNSSLQRIRPSTARKLEVHGVDITCFAPSNVLLFVLHRFPNLDLHKVDTWTKPVHTKI